MTMLVHERPRVAALGLSLEFYRQQVPEVISTYRQQLNAFVSELDQTADITSTTLAISREEVSQAIAQAERDDVDALLIMPLSYVASLVPAVPLLHTQLPLIIWNTQESQTIPPDYNFQTLLHNHVTQGTQDLTNVLVRSGRTFGMTSGHYQDAKALSDLGEWLHAARISRRMRELRVGLLGSPFQDFGDFGVDPTTMATTWGPEIVHLSMREFTDLYQETDAAEADKIVAADAKAYTIDDDLDPTTHQTSAALEIAVRTLVERHKLSAFTMNFADLINDGRVPTLPFLGINKLMGEGLGYAGEGDVLTAAHMTQLAALCGSATFTEIYTIDYSANRMMMTHMQECNPALARRDRPKRLISKPFWAPGTQPYAGMHFTLEPGPVTLTAMTTDTDGKFVYIVSQGTIVDMDPLANFDIPHWLVELPGPVGQWLTHYSQAAGPHHLVAAPGNHIESVTKLAHLQGFKVKHV